MTFTRAVVFIAVDFFAIADAYLRARKTQNKVMNEVHNDVDKNLAENKMDDTTTASSSTGMKLSLWRIMNWKKSRIFPRRGMIRLELGGYIPGAGLRFRHQSLENQEI